MTGASSRNRACAVCAGHDKKLLFRQQFSTLSSGSLLEGYDVVVCTRCGFGFADGVPGQAAFDLYYESMSKYENSERGGQESEFRSARFREIAELVGRVVPDRSAAILEIGCSTGNLLHALKETGYADVRGVDPSPACVEAAERLYGVPVLAGTFWSLPSDMRACDLLVLVGVLEHIRDVEEVLGRIRRILADDGMVFIEVPDAARFASRPDAPFQEFSTEHINFFTAASLANLMRVHGFEQVHVETGEVEQNVGAMSPVISGFYRKCAVPVHAADGLTRDETTEKGLVDYIDWSSRVDRGIREAVDRLVESRDPVLVWGVGTHTSRLMATSRLADANIGAFVDSNPRYQGKQMHGVPVLAPAELRGRREPILISSRVFQHEIARQIREDLGATNELILLYEVD